MRGKIHKKKVWLKRLAIAATVLVALGLIALEVVGFTARKAGVRAVDLPSGSEIAALAAGADYVDAYRIPLPCGGLSIDALLPAKAEREAARTPGEVVYRGTAPGLHFFASYRLEPAGDPTAFKLATAVFYDSALGVIYFTPVKYVHRRIVPLAVAKQAKDWCVET